MKCSETWLREWVNPKLTLSELGNKFTMGGLEVESIEPASQAFSNVVVGEVVAVTPHPELEHLQVCNVSISKSTQLQIVCGAPNVRVSLKVAVALDGAKLPHSVNIKTTVLRGIKSEGMLCSASELSLPQVGDGLLELPQKAPLGMKLWDYLSLDDEIIDLSITPNRGDCLSIKGIAREVAALTGCQMNEPILTQVSPIIEDILPVTVLAPAGCPIYIGRVIREAKTNVSSPIWLKERLRRSGLRSVNAIVDVVNYVMLELGQPMHAFDLQMINKQILVRQSKAGEKIVLLDGSSKILDAETLVIADENEALAIAGVMGGLNTSVTCLTNDIFLESAYFTPQTIARQRQFYHLNSDSSYRYERGIDYQIQRQAIERATQLIIEISGGKPGPVIEQIASSYLPSAQEIVLTREKVARLLGFSVTEKEIEKIYDLLNFTWHKVENGWHVIIPSYRPDLTLPEDLIEEIARLYGYDRIPAHQLKAKLQVNFADQNDTDYKAIREFLASKSYHEIISYSFVDSQIQKTLNPHEKPRQLINPITADMTVMRTNLWPGLIKTFLYNKSRQQHRIRLFEVGTCFLTHKDKLVQQKRLGGLVAGFEYPEQWGVSIKEVDIYSLKGDVLDLIRSLNPGMIIDFNHEENEVLHKGQSLGVYHLNQKLGILGLLHPLVLQKLDINSKVFLFDLDITALLKPFRPQFQAFSKFPEIRRDLALLVNEAIPAKDIQDTIRAYAGDWLKDIFIFDVYQGKGIEPGCKSIALALILQHFERTLVDEEIAELMKRVITGLKDQLGAELRS